MRESESERTPLTLVSHIPVRRVRTVIQGQHLTTVELAVVLDLRFCDAAYALDEPSGARTCIAIGHSFVERMKASE
jgi:hypothetical protein